MLRTLGLIAFIAAAPALAADGIKVAARGEPLTPTTAQPINLPIDPLGLNKAASSGSTSAGADDSIFARIASLVVQDFAHAAADAIAEPAVQDGNGYACATAWQPLANIIKRHPKVLSGQVADDLEGARLVIGAYGQICKVQACQTVASDAASIAAKAVSALPVSINLPAPINIFAKTCNDIPNIVLVPAPAGATPTPTPTATGG